MKQLLSLIRGLSEYQSLKDAAKTGGVLSLYGLSPVHQAHFAAALQQDLGRTFCFLTRDEASARSFAADFAAFSGSECGMLPCRDFVFHNIEGASRQYEQMRLGTLSALQNGSLKAIAAPADALMQRTLPPETLKNAAVRLFADGEYHLLQLSESLLRAGYTRCQMVEGPGQFALRGGILDVFPAGSDTPVRAEFFGDTVDSLGIFDTMTQRRSRNVEEVLILPARETLPYLAPDGLPGLLREMEKSMGKKCSDALRQTVQGDMDRLRDLNDLAAADRYLPLIYPQFATALDYLPADTVFISLDTPAVIDCAKGYDHRMTEDVTALLQEGILLPAKSGWSLNTEQLRGAISRSTLILLDSFLTTSGGFSPSAILSVTAKQLPSYGGNLDTAVGDLEHYLKLGYTVFAMAGGALRQKNLRSLLQERGLPCTDDALQSGSGRVCVLPYSLSAGFEYPAAKLAVICEGQAARSKTSKNRKKTASKNRLHSFSDLHPGDLVVHEHHGIGRFCNVERIQVDGVWRDYIKIAFAGTDFVFVPATSLDLISKYIGTAEDTGVKLSKLGGNVWEKTKARAKKSAQDLAQALIDLYAARQNKPGFTFLPDDDWQRSFEEAFPYEETDDQLTCIEEIKHDMQRPFPMDRLLCGDVGFGKTEVAFRAIMKCILSGKQAAVLVPTTVLARQHFISASQRFSGYPIRVEMLSRFRTPKQVKETLRKLKNGQCDLLIGTHRILQKDIQFKDLGLLVVDEEQRFGVSHKERIKQMTNTVDVLTLTATPIPRTLNMALSGIRDMSVLEEPPVGRQPVQTYVLEQDDSILFDAIRRELQRGGQVYYLHNRIDSIDRCAARLQQIFSEASVAVAHGRMTEEAIGSVMNRMYAGEVDILVCTTIIETGVDIPNVNTLIIEDADHMGLAQLHQIRGRVGRSARHAYAYLTYRRGKILTEISQKRLGAIREFAEFGSGIKIAMRDLEIRGAGNVLGAEQSGHMMNVGYDMYLRLLEEATGELKGETKVHRTDCVADILVSAGLPESYIPDAAARVDLYRRIAMISGKEDYMDMQDELIDRFGDLPRSAQALLDIALLRYDASCGGIYEIAQKDKKLLFYFRQEQVQRALAVCALPKLRGKVLLNAGDKPYMSLRMGNGENPLDAAIAFLRLYSNTEAVIQ